MSNIRFKKNKGDSLNWTVQKLNTFLFFKIWYSVGEIMSFNDRPTFEELHDSYTNSFEYSVDNIKFTKSMKSKWNVEMKTTFLGFEKWFTLGTVSVEEPISIEKLVEEYNYKYQEKVIARN